MNTVYTPINIDLIPTAEELHVVPSTGTGGRGIASDPLMIPKGDLDGNVFVETLGQSLKINFGEGRFFLSSFKPNLHTCVSIGQGVGKTILQLKDNVNSKLKNPYWPHIRMISDGGAWCLNYGMRDMTLDCNWRGQQEAVLNGNFKIEAVVVNSVRGKLERVDVVDSGSNGSKEIYGDVGLESFPIALQTVSMGPPFDKVFTEHKHRGEEQASFLEISQCRILSATFLEGGYCTGIFTVTNQPGAGDRLPKGARTTLAAWVHDCYVADIKGIAFGCAHSEHVLFERNHAVGSKCGFNCDTGRNENIILRGNQFVRNSHGVNFSPDGGGKGLLVEGNTFIAGPMGTNPITGLPEGYGGLSVRNTLEAVSKGNTFIGPSDWVDKKFTDYPVISIDYERLVIGSEKVTPGTHPPVPPGDDITQNDVIQLKEQLAAITLERTKAMDLNDALIAQNSTVEQRAEVLEHNLAEVTLERNAAMDRANTVIAENAKEADAKSVLERLLFEEKQRVLRAEIRESDNSQKLREFEKAVKAYFDAQANLSKLNWSQT